MSLIFFFFQLCTTGHGTLKNSCFPHRNFLEGNKIFIYYRRQYLDQGWTHVTASLNYRISSGTDSFGPGACFLCLWEFICVNSVDLTGFVSLVSSLPSECKTLLHGVSETSQEGFDGDITFRTEFSELSYSLHNVQLRVSVFVPILYRRLLF